MSGPGAAAVPLPARVLDAPFARLVRVARSRVGGVLDALLAGRGWIALVFVLLAGIVFFNVDLLQMNREIARNADKISALKRQNARLRLDHARLGSSERIQEAAARLGLVLPAPGEVRYRTARPTLDARRAARRITEPAPAPEPVWTAPVAPATPAPTTAAPTTGTTPPAATGVPAPGTAGTTTGATGMTGTAPGTAGITPGTTGMTGTPDPSGAAVPTGATTPTGQPAG
jgi:cell division protein FtsL